MKIASVSKILQKANLFTIYVTTTWCNGSLLLRFDLLIQITVVVLILLEIPS